MRPDDASPADMRRRFATPGAGSPPLDEDTLERLLAGDLPPHEAPPGYAEVAALLAATVAPPRPEELTGQAAALAELRAVTRTRTPPARARRTGRSRRRLGLAVVAVAGALVSGGAAAAAGGHLPEPVRDAAHSILVSVGGAAPTPPVVAPAPPGSGAGATTPSGPGPTDLARPAPGSPAAKSPAVPGTTAPDTKGLCRSYLATQEKQTGKKLEAASVDLLAEEAGGADKILTYCRHLLADDDKPKEGKQKPPPDDQSQGQGQHRPPPSTGGGQGRTSPPSTRTSR